MQDETARKITIRPAQGKWVVYTLGGIFGETTRALWVDEPGKELVVYVPREDIAMAFFDKSELTTHSPLKGEATYYSLDTKSKMLLNAAWSYEDPVPGAEAIKGYLAFDEEQVTVERQAKS